MCVDVVRAVVRTVYGNSEVFVVVVGMHQVQVGVLCYMQLLWK